MVGYPPILLLCKRDLLCQEGLQNLKVNHLSLMAWRLNSSSSSNCTHHRINFRIIPSWKDGIGEDQCHGFPPVSSGSRIKLQQVLAGTHWAIHYLLVKILQTAMRIRPPIISVFPNWDLPHCRTILSGHFLFPLAYVSADGISQGHYLSLQEFHTPSIFLSGAFLSVALI